MSIEPASDRDPGSSRPNRGRHRWPARSGEPVTVRETLDTLAATMGLASVDGINRLFLNWAEVVGEELATKCSPKRLHHGELVVEAIDRQWASELSWMTALIAKRCNATLGDEVVIEVRIAR